MTSAAAPRAALTASVVGVGAALVGAVLLATAAGSVEVLIGIAGVVAAGVGMAVAQPGPLARLGGVLALQVLQLQGGRGTDVGEVVAGLALVGYLAHWYIEAVLSGRPLVRTLFDAAAVTWGTVGMVAAAGIGLVFGPDAYDFRADVLATLPFLFYLPVKEACVRYDRGGLMIGAVLVGFGAASTVLNALLFRDAVTGASALYEIADARFNVGEIWITAGLMATLAAGALARSRRLTLGAVGMAGFLLAGLIVTKSRGFWIAAVVGAVAMAVVVPGRGRRRLVGYGALGLVSVAVLALAFFGEQLTLVALGALDRLVSLGSATSDPSLLNRFVESAAVWEKIRVNPILGYGWGVQVTYYSILSEGTRSWAFLHNGYLSLWYKTGLWGLGLMMTVWIGAMARAARAARRPRLGPRDRALALGAGATIAALTPVAASSNPFSILDQVLVVTLVLALAHGMADRADALRGASR